MCPLDVAIAILLSKQTQHAVDMKRFKDKITGLLREFEQRFGELEKDFTVFCLQFTMNASDLPSTSNLK